MRLFYSVQKRECGEVWIHEEMLMIVRTRIEERIREDIWESPGIPFMYQGACV